MELIEFNNHWSFRRRDSYDKIIIFGGAKVFKIPIQWSPVNPSPTYLDGIDVVGDADERSLFLLNEGCDGVNPVSKNGSPLGGGVLFALGPGLGSGPQTLLLLLFGLGTVLVQKAEQLSR